MTSYQKSVERSVLELKAANTILGSIAFPDLVRPAVLPNAPPTPELVDWAVRVYCFSVLSHFKELLRSVLLLVEVGHIPAAFIVSRSLFEIGAQAYYVKKHVDQYLNSGDLVAAWQFLFEINLGSRYMREEHGGKAEEAFPEPRDIAKVMRCFDEYFNIGEAATTYSFLSEFSHPNSAAFMHYFDWKADSSGETKITFVPPSSEKLAMALPAVAIALAALLHCGMDLLNRIGDTKVAARLDVALTKLIRAHEEGAS